MRPGIFLVASLAASCIGRSELWPDPGEDPVGDGYSASGDAGGDAGPGSTAGHCGSAIISPTVTEVSVSLPSPAVPRHSVLFFGVAHASEDPANGHVSGTLDSNDEVRFVRFSAVPMLQVNIDWCVLQSDLFDVQRGTTTMPADQLDIPLNPVNLGRSFATVSMHVNGDIFDEEDWVLANLIESDRLELNRALPSGSDAAFVSWQVVEMTGAQVQSGVVQLASDEMSRCLVPLPLSAPPAESFALFTQKAFGSSVQTAGAYAVTGFLHDGGICFDRQAIGTGIEISYFVVTSDDIRAQHGDLTFDPTVVLIDNPLPEPVDPNRAVSLIAGQMRQGSTPHSTTDRVGIGWFSSAVRNDGSRIAMRRGAADDEAQVTWTVVELLD